MNYFKYVKKLDRDLSKLKHFVSTFKTIISSLEKVNKNYWKK